MQLLDNRELATVLVGLGVVAIALSIAGARSTVELIRATLQPGIVIILALHSAWIGLLAYGGYIIGIWHTHLFLPTFVWAFGMSVALLYSASQGTSRSRVRRDLGRTISIGAAITVWLNAYVFSLPIEIVLQFGLSGLVFVHLIAGQRIEWAPARRFTTIPLLVVAFVLGIHTVRSFFENASYGEVRLLLSEVALPVWLTIGYLPFLLAASVFMTYEGIFLLSRIHLTDVARWRRGMTYLAMLGIYRLDLGGIRKVRPYALKQIAAAPGPRSALRTTHGIRRQYQESKRDAADEKLQPLAMAGLPGAREDGRRRDTREFEATKKSLQFLSAAQMGWFRNRGGTYRKELLDILETRFDEAGLPRPHRIVLQIAPDGQSWWAWRRTITGWCFAIGAAGPPPDEWRYDGPEPPVGFPGADPTWGEKWETSSDNW